MLRPLVCTALACLAVACGGPAADRPRGAEAPDAGSAAGPASSLTIAIADPRSRHVVERSIDLIADLVSDERLVAVQRDGRSDARLAERWEVSPDGLTWRFTLRPGLTFQDGAPITSADVKASLPLPDRSNEGATLPGLRDLTAIETPGPRDVVMRLARPNAFLLESLHLSAIRSVRGARAGPFRLDSRTSGKAALGRFKGYYRGRPSLETIGITEYPSQREAWSAMLRGDVDLLYDVAPDAFEFVRESPNAHVASFLRPFVTTLVFNVAHPTLGRRDVRRALNLAVDRRGIVATVVGGRGLPATDHIWPSHWARDAAAPAFEFDPAAARAALDAAGLRLAKAGAAPPVRLTFTCLVQADPRYERLALLIQRQLLGVGVDMRLEAVQMEAFAERVAAGRFQAFLSDVIAGHGLDLAYWSWHSSPPGPYFRPGYKGADGVLDRLRRSRTDDDTRVALHDLQRTMFEDPPAIFLYWPFASRAVSRRFLIPGEEGHDILRSVGQWQLAERAEAATP